jgi:hypothetical protein
MVATKRHSKNRLVIDSNHPSLPPLEAVSQSWTSLFPSISTKGKNYRIRLLAQLRLLSRRLEMRIPHRLLEGKRQRRLLGSFAHPSPTAGSSTRERNELGERKADHPSRQCSTDKIWHVSIFRSSGFPFSDSQRKCWLRVFVSRKGSEMAYFICF